MMGISISNAQVVGESISSANETKGMVEEDDLEMERSLPEFEGSRLVKLMQALQGISKLQEEAANAEIDRRQKMREVGFKRQAVWSSDAAFMRDLQRLMAQGRLEGLQELVRLATDCQVARDSLGPLEQEGIVAEQRWEGIIWKLRQAEQKVHQEFTYEFQSAQSYPPPASAESSQYESSSEFGSTDDGDHNSQGIFPHQRAGGSVISSSSLNLVPSTSNPLPEGDASMSQNTTLLGMEETAGPAEGREIDIHKWDSDSGIGDIDRVPDATDDLIGPAQSLPTGPHASIELYPQLLTDFTTRRDRINKWLQHTTLVSRFEATLLRDQLALESVKTPSNWSQLVIAYWELDGAANPKLQQAEQSGAISQHDTAPLAEPDMVKSTAHNDSTIQPSQRAHLKLWSPASSNAGHGYFSDFKSGNRESLTSFLVPRRPAPLRPRVRSKSDAGQNSIHQVPKDHEPP